MHQIDFIGITSVGWTILFLYWIYTGMKTKVVVRRQTTSSRLFYLVLIICGFGLVYRNFKSLGFLNERFLPDSTWVPYVGLIINMAGIIFAIIARSWLGTNWSGIATIKKDHELIRTGPYAITRHPIYTGLLFGLFGTAIIIGEWRGLVGTILLFIGVQLKIAVEEKMLKEVFPEYDQYSRHTKKLIPLIY